MFFFLFTSLFTSSTAISIPNILHHISSTHLSLKGLTSQTSI
jgi:hypothetical protein